ncbi:Rhodanese-like domain-containing protein [Chytriomyces sp. MP71]|nr:Rhodanese-like domain-containing protein [Chytriomyces sp. MP71]
MLANTEKPVAAKFRGLQRPKQPLFSHKPSQDTLKDAEMDSAPANTRPGLAAKKPGFTRHATCLARLEHTPFASDDDDLSDAAPCSPMRGIVGKGNLFGESIPSVVMDAARIAPLMTKPPRLPFPTASKGTSHWNSRGSTKNASISLKPVPKFGLSAVKSESVPQAAIKPVTMETEMDFQTEIRRSPVLKSKRPLVASSMLHAEPLLLTIDTSFCTDIAKEVGIKYTDVVEGLLPCKETSRDALKRITPETMAEIIKGKYTSKFIHQIVDCRFPYEHAGGHIADAINIQTTHDLERTFFPTPPSASLPRVIVFHCEFSAQRAPKM